MIDWEQLRTMQEILDRLQASELRKAREQIAALTPAPQEIAAIREQFAALTPAPQEIAAIREQFAALEQDHQPAQAHLVEINKIIESARQLYPHMVVEEARRAIEGARGTLERAVSPLPILEFEALSSTYALRVADLRDAYERMNLAIAEADYIGEVEISTEERKEEEGESSSHLESLEEKLVEVVPAATLNNLKSVEFAPFGILDRILRSPKAMTALGAREFEEFVAALVEKLGFEDVFLTPRSGDGGRDVVATKRVLGIPIFFAFECKRHSPDRPVGPDFLRALLGTITHGETRADRGVLVTTSTFTRGARNYLITEPRVEGKDFDGIVGWLGEYARKR